jgi:hypothetical protein
LSGAHLPEHLAAMREWLPHVQTGILKKVHLLEDWKARLTTPATNLR